MAQQRLAAMGDAPPVDQLAQQAQLDRFQAQPVPVLQESFPVESPHLAKARLLANAGLNDYIAQEIAADPDSSSWSALAEGQIYASYGEHFRALRALRRAFAVCHHGLHQVHPAALLADSFPGAVVGHDRG